MKEDTKEYILMILISAIYAVIGGYVTLYLSMDMGSACIVTVLIYYLNQI